MINSFKVYKNILASINDTTDVIIPSNKTYCILGISFTVPADKTNVASVIWDPDGVNEIQEAAQSDKYVDTNCISLDGNGIKKIRINLDNSQNPEISFMGVTIYYEEHG